MLVLHKDAIFHLTMHCLLNEYHFLANIDYATNKKERECMSH